MPSREDDKALRKSLRLFKGYGSRRLLAEFPMDSWMLDERRLDTLLEKVKETKSTDRT